MRDNTYFQYIQYKYIAYYCTRLSSIKREIIDNSTHLACVVAALRGCYCGCTGKYCDTVRPRSSRTFLPDARNALRELQRPPLPQQLQLRLRLKYRCLRYPQFITVVVVVDVTVITTVRTSAEQCVLLSKKATIAEHYTRHSVCAQCECWARTVAVGGPAAALLVAALVLNV